MRDYAIMRNILETAANAEWDLAYNDFRPAAGQDDDRLEAELARLDRDGLIEADVFFAKKPYERSRCTVSGLTDEGMEFYRLIENDKVWEVVLLTLNSAGIDVSYPLLKEVCEEIVKRYVTSFIPI